MGKYSCKLKEAICGEDGRESKYEYRIASTKFLPGNDRGFYNLFYEAFEYGQAYFLKAVFWLEIKWAVWKTVIKIKWLYGEWRGVLLS